MSDHTLHTGSSMGSPEAERVGRGWYSMLREDPPGSLGHTTFPYTFIDTPPGGWQHLVVVITKFLLGF